jgi:hypothetical protein
MVEVVVKSIDHAIGRVGDTMVPAGIIDLLSTEIADMESVRHQKGLEP